MDQIRRLLEVYRRAFPDLQSDVTPGQFAAAKERLDGLLLAMERAA